MGMKKDLLLVGAYFLILSTVLQAEDAFVTYYDWQFEPQKDTLRNSRGKMLVAFAIVALLNYTTLVLAPYFNCSIQRLATAACAILLLKYACELATYTKIMPFVFELGAFFADIVGTGLFYLSTLRIVQLMVEKHGLKEKAGLCFGVTVALYAFSVLLGYVIGDAFFEGTPAWLFLIALTCFTILAAAIAYFSFGLEIQPSADGQNNNNNNRAAVGEEEGFQLFRDGLHFGNIFRFTLKTYTKLLPLMGVQMMIGTLFAYGYSLLKFLIWTSQTQSVGDKLSHNRDTMVLYGIGGMFSSCLIGFICDRLPTRKLGYGLLAYNGLSLVFLYFALYIKYFYTTLLLFMFLGMTQFAVLVWLMAAISKLYKGIFEVIAANAQSVAMAASGYGFGAIFFEGRMVPQTKLGIELALLIGMNVVAFLFARKLPDDPVTIDYLVEEVEENSEGPTSRVREETVQRREAPVEVEIEMVQKHRELEEQLQQQQRRTVDPQNLL